MTSAMNKSFMISPNYQGPMMIESYARKIKTSKSLGRVISSYNKRYFVLDLKRLLFYYLSDKLAALSSGSDIPLDSINRMYIDTDATAYMKEDQSWLHGVTILTKKKAIRLKFENRQTLDVFTTAFNHIINLQTKEPIYSIPTTKNECVLQPEFHPYFNNPKNSSNSNTLEGQNSESNEVKTPQKEQSVDVPGAKRRDSKLIFSPSDSEKVMKAFDSEENIEKEKSSRKKKSIPTSSTSSVEEPKSKEEGINSVGKIKTPERTKKNLDEETTESIVIGEVKNKSEKVDVIEDVQQPEQVDNTSSKKAPGLGKFDDLKISNDIELEENAPNSTANKTGGIAPMDGMKSARRLSRRNMSSGGINLLGEIKKSAPSQEGSFANNDSKKNSWDEENSDEDKNKATIRRPSNLLAGNKTAGLSRLSLRKDDEGAVKSAVSNIWKDNFSAEPKKEPVQATKKDDNWDDWDKDMETQPDDKPIPKSNWKPQPDNEQTYNYKSNAIETKPKSKEFDPEPIANKKTVEAKPANHNDWDDDWD